MRSCHAGINFWEIYLVDWDTFQDKSLVLNLCCSLFITDTKLDNHKRPKRNNGLLPNNQYIGGVELLIGCIQFKWANVKQLTLRKIRNRQLPIFKLLSQLHSREVSSFILCWNKFGKGMYYCCFL